MKPIVLVTGAAGFIGSHVAERLCHTHEVIGIDDFSGGRMENIPQNCVFREANCTDTIRIRSLFHTFKPRFVIHCAAMAAENLSHNCRRFTYQNNLIAEATVRNAAINHNVECMVSLSSIAVMGHQEPPFAEFTHPAPRDPYGISKLAGEMDAQAAREFFGLNYVIFRPHNVIGTRQNMADRYRNVAAIFVRAIQVNRPLPIFGDGLQTRAFSPVSYVADIIAASISRPETWNRVFNVGSDTPLTILGLKATLEGILQKELPAHHYPARQEAVHAHMTHDEVRNAFPDIKPWEKIEDVLADMLEEAMSTVIPPMQKGPEIEVEKNLPEAWR